MAETTHQTVLAELRRFGLKPSVENTGSGHKRVLWTVPGTILKRSIITPSEHGGEDPRARLNARAEVRRLVKADGIVDPVIAHAKKPITKKILEPAPHNEPVHVQIAEMRSQFDQLTDLVLEMAVNLTAIRNIVAPPLLESLPGPVGDLAKLPADKFITTDEYARLTGKNRPAAYQQLRYQEGIGNVEQRSKMWRRLPKAFVPPPAPPTVPVMSFEEPVASEQRVNGSTIKITGFIGEALTGPAAKLTPGSWQLKTFLALPEDGTPIKTDALAEKTEHAIHLVSLVMHHLKARGMAMTPARGWWRRTDKPLPEGWTKPVKVKPVKPPKPMSERKRPGHAAVVREQVLAAIPTDRTFTTRELAKAVGKNYPATYFHLKQFKDAGLIKKLGGTTGGYWVKLNRNGTPVASVNTPPPTAEAAFPKKGKTRQAILDAIPLDRAITREEIATATRLNGPAVGFHLTALKDAGLIAKVGGGRDIGWTRGDATKVAASAKADQPVQLRLLPNSVTDIVWKALPEDRPMSIIELKKKTHREPNPIGTALRMLKAKGVVANVGHGLWAKVAQP